MTEASWLIGRQPILDREERVTAYELLFRASHAGRAEVGDPSRATATVILGALSGFGVQEVLGGHRGFINVDQELLFSDSLELLPREVVVLELLETVKPSAAVVQRCRDLKAAGFALALDDHRFDAAFEDLYRIVDVVKLDLTISPVETLATEVECLRGYPFALLAEKVETRREFQRCLDLGFASFQGYYFARPALLERRRIDEAGATLLKLLRLLMCDAEIGEVEGAIRESPGLTYKLLVLVNSVAMGSRERIATLRHAIAMLGRTQMRRWVQLALFTSNDQRGLDDPLVDMAATRAGFMEQLARCHPGLGSGGDASEQAFMAGILSLLDAIYAISMDDLVKSLNLSEEVGAALLRREGPLGELLTVVERIERLEIDAASKQLQALGITQQDAFEAQRSAFAWRSRGP